LPDIVKLPNGVTVIGEPMPSLSVSLGIFVRAGSALEHPEQNGLAHMIEHLVFKGTERMSGLEIAWAIDDLGGDLNAYTAKEYTCYYCRVLPKEVDRALSVLADLVVRPRFDPLELQRERGVILEEIRLMDDTPDELVQDLLEEAIFPGHPLGSPVLGTTENVSAFTEQDVRNFYHSYYRSENIVVSAAGDFAMEWLVPRVAELFTDLPQSAVPAHASHPTASRTVLVRERGYGELHMCVGGVAVSAMDPRTYDLNILLAILGGGPSSRLFQRLREEEGISYNVYAFDSIYSTTGIFGIYLDLVPEHVTLATDLLREELYDLADVPVSREELARARAQVETQFVLGLEAPYSRMERNAISFMLQGRIPSIREVQERLQAVTPVSVMALAQSLFAGGNLSLAAVGPWPRDVIAERLVL
jgi:predicted Zn-dependent peptidase